jgi:hypothetical protein
VASYENAGNEQEIFYKSEISPLRDNIIHYINISETDLRKINVYLSNIVFQRALDKKLFDYKFT